MAMETNTPLEDDGGEFNILEYIGLLRKHLRIIMFAGFIGAVLGVVFYTMQPKIYTATARMKIDPFQRTSLDYGDSGTPLLGAYYFRTEYLNTEFQIMRSRNVLNDAVNSVGVAYFEENMPELKPKDSMFNVAGMLAAV